MNVFSRVVALAAFLVCFIFYCQWGEASLMVQNRNGKNNFPSSCRHHCEASNTFLYTVLPGPRSMSARTAFFFLSTRLLIVTWPYSDGETGVKHICCSFLNQCSHSETALSPIICSYIVENVGLGKAPNTHVYWTTFRTTKT